MTQPKEQRHFVVCVQNKDYPVALEPRKIYEIIPDTKAKVRQQLRVIDESGEDYLYPDQYFLPIDLPGEIEQAFTVAA